MTAPTRKPADAPLPDVAGNGAGGGPLSGVRVLELGSLLAGPFVGRLLGDFGAEVIKVEAPGTGDPLREWGVHRYRGRSLWWTVQSRNKKLVTLNLRQERGQEIAHRLADASDVLVENFRPGTLERWGLSPEHLHETNPGLIIARVSGYGQTGPYADRAGFASVGEAMGGMRYINGFPDQPPPRSGISLGDSLAAMFATQGVLMALYERMVHPGAQGQVIDASIMESCFALLESMVPDYDKMGVVRHPTGTVLPHVAPSNVYRSKDGRWVDRRQRREPLAAPLQGDRPRGPARQPALRHAPAARRAHGGARRDHQRVGGAARRRRDRPASQRRQGRLRSGLHDRRHLR